MKLIKLGLTNRACQPSRVPETSRFADYSVVMDMNPVHANYWRTVLQTTETIPQNLDRKEYFDMARVLFMDGPYLLKLVVTKDADVVLTPLIRNEKTGAVESPSYCADELVLESEAQEPIMLPLTGSFASAHIKYRDLEQRVYTVKLKEKK